MDSLSLCIENFTSYTEMLGGSPCGDLLRADGGLAGASGLASAGENYAVFGPGATENDLSSVVGFFGIRRLPFAVPVFPGLDDKFAHVLERHGVIPRHEYAAMSLPLAGRPRETDDAAAAVTDAQSLEAWTSAVWLGFGDQGNPDLPFARHAAYLASCPANRLYYLAEGGNAVCAGLLHQSEHVCGLYYFATPPEFRRRGFAFRLLKALSAQAAQHSNQLVLLATEEGRPVYEKFGFQTLAMVPVRMKGEE
jgi:GNAT superfamily N-acetyltransferase